MEKAIHTSILKFSFIVAAKKTSDIPAFKTRIQAIKKWSIKKHKNKNTKYFPLLDFLLSIPYNKPQKAAMADSRITFVFIAFV